MKFTYAPESQPLAGYTIKRGINTGGFGEVYYAISDAGKEVALKLLQRDIDVEVRGIQSCLNLKHPNLLSLFDLKTDADGGRWLVMEYIAGESLERTLRSNPKGMPLADIDNWLKQMCAGVAYLHGQGIVHRDLKPANIFQEQSVVKIGDVGLAKAVSPSQRSAQTESVGTVYYMAPEVAKGKYGTELDVYSLGIILYEMATGSVPFTGESTAEILMKHLSAAPDLSRLPEKLRPVVGHALEKDPLKRTPNAQALWSEYSRAISGTATPVELAAADFVPGRNGRPTLPPPSPPQPRPASPQEARGVPRVVNNPPAPRRSEAPKSNGWWSPGIIAVSVLLLMLAGGGRGPIRSWAFLGLAGGVALGAYWIARGMSQLKSAPVPHVPVVAGKPRPRSFSPEMTRRIPATQRTSDLLLSMSTATLWTGAITLLLIPTTELFGRMSGNLHVEKIGLFALTTLLASWILMLPGKLWEGRAPTLPGRRISLAALGAFVGASAYGINEFLFTHLGGNSSGAIRSFGPIELVTPDYQPELAGFIVFFTLLFGLRQWWRHSDSFRPYRFHLGSVALTTLLGGVVASLFSFPADWGLALAAGISTVVHLSSGWIPQQDRPAYWEGLNHAA